MKETEYIMKNPNLGVRLRYYREAANLTVKDVVIKLETEYNMEYSPKTIYSWERGQNQPPADTLLSLCHLYNITNIVESLGYGTQSQELPLILTSEEKELITKYRERKYLNAAIRKLLDMEDEA